MKYSAAISTRVRCWWAVLVGGLTMVFLNWPTVALAGDCDNWYDLGKSSACKIDVAQYSFYESVASTIWMINRVLLGGAHWLDALRFQFVQVIFAGAYSRLAEAIGPLLGPVAVLALVAGGLLLIAMPLTGTTGPINFRMIFIWIMIGPLLLTLSGPYMVEFEKLRTDLGTTLFRGVAGSSFTLSGGAAKDMAAPTNLYPSSVCGLDNSGRPLLQRYTENPEPTIDEQVAALVWANAQDIHCPNAGDGASSTLPDMFFVDAPQGPGYFAAGGIQNRSQDDRTRYLESEKEAINRLLLAVLPSFVAFLISLLNFVFACCTMMLWFSLPLGLLFSFFNTNAGWFTDLVKRGGEILKTSWLISILLGVFSSILLEAGAAGDALRYAILTIISGIFVAKFTSTSFSLFSGAISAMSAASGLGGGASLGSLGGAALSGAAKMGVGAMTGGVGAVGMGAAAAFTGATAMKQTGSGGYALAAAAGRFRPLMQLGEVASSMGLLGGEAADGLYAGKKSNLGLREGRKQMAVDSQKKGEDGRTLQQRSQDNQLDRAIQGVGQRSAVGRVVGGVGSAAGGVKAAGTFVKENLTEEQLAARAQQTVAAGKRIGLSAKDSVGVMREKAVEGMRTAIQNPDLAATAAIVGVGRGVGAGVRAAKAGVGIGARGGSAVGRSLASSYQRHAAPRDRSLDVMWQNGKQLRSDRHVDEVNLPQDAQTSALTNAEFREKVKSGNRIQRNQDGTATYWKEQTPEKSVRSVQPKRKRVSPTMRSGAVSSSAASLNLGRSQQPSSPQRGQTNNGEYFIDGRAEAKRIVDEALSPAPPKPAPHPRAAQLVAAHQQRVQDSQQASQPWKTARKPSQRSGRPRPKLR